MDFNDDFDFEPADDIKESVIDSNEEETKEKFDSIFNSKVKSNNQEDNLREEFKKLNRLDDIFNNKEKIVPLKNIFTKKEIEEIKNKEDDFTAIEFSENFNKLKKQNDILQMNPELKEKVVQKSFFQKYAVVLPIFAFISTLFLGIYIFSTNIKADETNLIKVEEKNKVGYINDNGEKVVKSKYISGTDFYKGFAIVKNQNNLSGVINNKGNLEAYFGDYFYIERFSNDYVASKFTNTGLKLGLLDSSLKEITKFKYDNITYATNNTYLFSRDDVMGVMDEKGVELYTFAVDEVDNKDISIEVSKIDNDDVKSRYAKVKINNSSTIINLYTGKEITKYTLNEIKVLENNVFYIKDNKNQNKYIYIQDDKIKYQTTKYKLIRMEDIGSDILVCLNNDMTYDYVNLNNGKVMNENNNIKYYYGSGLLLENKNDFESGNDNYKIKNAKRTLGEVNNIKLVDDTIVNEMIKVYTKNMKYNFINKEGKQINENEYDDIEDFDKFGFAIVKKNNYYGVINKEGKEVIPLKYDKIKTINEDLFKILKDKYDKELFIYNDGNKKGIISSKNDIIIKASYSDFKFITTKYPIIIGIIDNEQKIINLDSKKEFNINVEKDIEVHDNYIFIDDKYYNYDGKHIYTLNQEG